MHYYIVNSYRILLVFLKDLISDYYKILGFDQVANKYIADLYRVLQVLSNNLLSRSLYYKQVAS